MAKLLWGRVYLYDRYVGVLQQEPAETFCFSYDPNYLDSPYPALSHTLPKKTGPYRSFGHLHPYFDNLVSEGWLEKAQTQ